MKKILILLTIFICTFTNGQVTSSALKAQIDTDITNKIGANSISKVNVGNSIKSTVDFTVQEVALKANLASPALTGNPTAPTPTVGDNDTSIATTAFVTTNNPLKTSGQQELSATPSQLLYDLTFPYSTNGIGYLPSTTLFGKTIIVYPIETVVIRGNVDNTASIQVTPGSSSVTSITLQPDKVVKFTYIGGGNWFAEYMYPLMLVQDTTSTAYSTATLNSTYPATLYGTGFTVSCPYITGGGFEYTRLNSGSWSKKSITLAP